MLDQLNRREFLTAAGAGAIACLTPTENLWSATSNTNGAITGDAFGDVVGQQILDEGGNAVDAVVAAAFVAAVTSLSNCGIGGYGGHMTIGLANGQTSSIDFNGTAPAAITADLFESSNEKGGYSQRGWRSAGVPGILAGLQLAIDKFGTKPLSELLQPAIAITRDGFKLPDGTARAIQRYQKTFQADAGSSKLFLPNGDAPKAGSTFRNSDLAKLLAALAEENNVEPFYRGKFAEQIAEGFQKNGGLLTYDDMAQYEARVVAPVHLKWRNHDIYTAPLTAGGFTSLQILKILDHVGLENLSDEVSKSHAQLEAHRIAWADRLKMFGDPNFVDVPLDLLLSDESTKEKAQRVSDAVRQKKKVDVHALAKDHDGTCHISAADKDGNLVSMTFTHGQGFGSLVTVDGMGLLLGHGVSRFETDPKHPNAPGPGKRPLNNMCPTVVLRDGRPVLALGGRGGRRIPNAIACSLLHFVGEGTNMNDAINGKRLHTEGDDSVVLQGNWSKQTREHFQSLEYSVSKGSVARVDAVSFHPSQKNAEKGFH